MQSTTAAAQLYRISCLGFLVSCSNLIISLLPLRSSCVHDEDDEDDDDDDDEEEEIDDDEEEEDDEGPDNADRRWLTCPLTWCPCAAAPYGSDDAPLRQGHHAAGRDRLRGRVQEVCGTCGVLFDNTIPIISGKEKLSKIKATA